MIFSYNEKIDTDFGEANADLELQGRCFALTVV